jgi:hypothetical protein
MPCTRCGEVRDSTELDRLLWCEACVEDARSRARTAGTGVGLATAVAVGLWVWFAVEPSRLIPGAWLASLVAAGWLGSKLAREVAWGVIRSRE